MNSIAEVEGNLHFVSDPFFERRKMGSSNSKNIAKRLIFGCIWVFSFNLLSHLREI